jgi:hypothetical protein
MMINGNGTTKYRGLGHNVAGMTEAEALKVAGLDWKTVQLPLVIQGRTEQRPSAYKSLVRSDNGVELGVSTASYKPVHNHQLVGAMREAAGAAGVMLEQMGSLDDGRRVWAVGTVPNTGFSLPVGKEWEERMERPHGGTTSWVTEDKTVLKVLMGAGHVPGMAITMEFMAERLICTNGAKISRELGSFRMTHSGHWGPAQVARIHNMLKNAGLSFERYEAQARIMRDVKMSREEGELFVIQLLQPKILEDIVANGRVSARVRDTDGVNGFNPARLMEEMVGREDRLITPDMFNRATGRVLELVPNQPGAGMAQGTVWNQFNAVTYFVDHERGRTSDSGLNAAFFGEGANLKEGALELAGQYAAALRN